MGGPGDWGIMLAGLADHVSNAYEQGAGRDRSEVLARIRQGFDAEWQSPTDEAQGNLLEDAADACCGASAILAWRASRKR